MNGKSDARLLRDYAEGGSEPAFREIVTRHTDFVYSAALRQVESSAAARDIAQGVFTDLARKASSLAQGNAAARSSLAGWLHRATRYAALNHLRDDRRRLANEREAMNQLLTNTESPAVWEQIRPTLDEALDSLDDEDREALLLRYFKNQDFRTVGLALGVSDDAAQKRVSRAVEKLREFFSKRNVTIDVAGLTVLISANAVQSAPVGLAVAISTAALAGTAVSTSTVIAATKTIAMTTIQKTIIGATLAVAVGTGVFEAHQASQLREQVQAFQQQQAAQTQQLQQLQRERDDATNRLASLQDIKQKQRQRMEHLELLSLRGRVNQLNNELRQQRNNPSQETSSNAAASTDSVLFSASQSNHVANGQTLVLGGWQMKGIRGYLLVSPTVQAGDPSTDEEPITVRSQLVAAPDGFWNQIGWQDAKSDTRCSALTCLLTSEQSETLIEAVGETEGGMIPTASLTKEHDGQLFGIGYSQWDNGQPGVLMGIDIVPRIASDGESVNIEVRPTPVSESTPVHSLLR